MQIKMNKKADLPVIVLVVGIVGICILTILSFVKVNTEIDDNFLGIGLIETMLSIEEELNFYSNEGLNFEGIYENIELIELKNVKIITDGKKVLKGTYAIQKCAFLGFDCKDKKMVWVEYKK